MSDIQTRRLLMELADTAVRNRGPGGLIALLAIPQVVERLLNELTDGPVRVYIAIDKEEVAALEGVIGGNS